MNKDGVLGYSDIKRLRRRRIPSLSQETVTQRNECVSSNTRRWCDLEAIKRRAYQPLGIITQIFSASNFIGR